MSRGNITMIWVLTAGVLLVGAASGLPSASSAEEVPVFEMEEVTVSDTKITMPVLVQEVKPEYPMLARRAGAQGTAQFRIQVMPDGSVGEIQIQRSTGSQVLDESARKALQQWKFKPGLSGKKPITAWMTVPIRFELTQE